MASENVLWAATVRSKSFEERCKAAKAGGFTEMSAFPIDIKLWEESGNNIRQLRELATTYGVRISVLDPLTKWLPRWSIPSYMSDSDAAFVDFDLDEFFRMAVEMNVDSFSIIETFGTSYTMEELVSNATRIANQAAELGMNVHVEFMPFSGIPELRTAWEIVKRTDLDNFGMVFDTWHYFRGTVDDRLLASIPGEKIFRTQLSDAMTELQGKDIFDDLMHHRLFPGAGQFPLQANYQLLEQIGATSSVGIEIFSDEVDQMEPETIGRKSQKSLVTLKA